jgi:hypothetical protein
MAALGEALGWERLSNRATRSRVDRYGRSDPQRPGAVCGLDPGVREPCADREPRSSWRQRREIPAPGLVLSCAATHIGVAPWIADLIWNRGGRSTVRGRSGVRMARAFRYGAATVCADSRALLRRAGGRTRGLLDLMGTDRLQVIEREMSPGLYLCVIRSPPLPSPRWPEPCSHTSEIAGGTRPSVGAIAGFGLRMAPAVAGRHPRGDLDRVGDHPVATQPAPPPGAVGGDDVGHRRPSLLLRPVESSRHVVGTGRRSQPHGSLSLVETRLRARAPRVAGRARLRASDPRLPRRSSASLGARTDRDLRLHRHHGCRYVSAARSPRAQHPVRCARGRWREHSSITVASRREARNRRVPRGAADSPGPRPRAQPRQGAGNCA